MLDVGKVARALNAVRSAGQARAAAAWAQTTLAAAEQETLPQLSWFGGTATRSAVTAALIRDGRAVDGAARAFAGLASADPVPPAAWATLRAAIDDVTRDVYGAEGAAATVSQIDRGQILLDSIVGAPGVIGGVLAGVTNAVGEVAGGTLGGLIGGLGIWGLLAIVVVAMVLLKVRL